MYLFSLSLTTRENNGNLECLRRFLTAWHSSEKSLNKYLLTLIHCLEIEEVIKMMMKMEMIIHQLSVQGLQSKNNAKLRKRGKSREVKDTQFNRTRSMRCWIKLMSYQWSSWVVATVIKICIRLFKWDWRSYLINYVGLGKEMMMKTSLIEVKTVILIRITNLVLRVENRVVKITIREKRLVWKRSKGFKSKRRDKLIKWMLTNKRLWNNI